MASIKELDNLRKRVKALKKIRDGTVQIVGRLVASSDPDYKVDEGNVHIALDTILQAVVQDGAEKMTLQAFKEAKNTTDKIIREAKREHPFDELPKEQETAIARVSDLIHFRDYRNRVSDRLKDLAARNQALHELMDAEERMGEIESDLAGKELERIDSQLEEHTAEHQKREAETLRSITAKKAALDKHDDRAKDAMKEAAKKRRVIERAGGDLRSIQLAFNRVHKLANYPSLAQHKLDIDRGQVPPGEAIDHILKEAKRLPPAGMSELQRHARDVKGYLRALAVHNLAKGRAEETAAEIHALEAARERRHQEHKERLSQLDARRREVREGKWKP